ncbi:MAG TPA: 1-deoxy-D-xylulose-5-phosphate reductoisomerase, partial [Actinomycetales bacterium]|nr:1-deoxy-D-xylulose-5-phosphate reductoisomerase [Actinomycetales bacterium]
HPAVFNAANEEAVARFLTGNLPFLSIVETVSEVLSRFKPSAGDDVELPDVVAAEDWARQTANTVMGK